MPEIIQPAAVVYADHTMSQLTVLSRPGSILKTLRYGELRWDEYLEREAERIRQTPGRTAIVVRHKSGDLSLAVDNLAERRIYRSRAVV